MSSLVRKIDTIPVPLTEQGWCKALLAGQLSEQTRRSYKNDFLQFENFLDGIPVTHVSRQEIYNYRSWLISEYSNVTTINRKLSAVRTLYREAVRNQFIAVDPTSGIRGFKIDSNYTSTLSPSYDEIRRLIDSVSGSSLSDARDKAILYVFCTMGLRRDEVSKLCVNSIVNDSGKFALDVMGKGSKRRRIEIPASTLQIVTAWIFTAQLEGDMPMFQEIKSGTLTGRALTGSGIYFIVMKRFAAAGLEGYQVHSLRHFLITHLIEKGADIYQVSRIAGHSDSKTTRRYDANSSGLCSSAAKLVDF